MSEISSSATQGWSLPRVFGEQTDLPVYRAGIPGYWTINGWWGNAVCPYHEGLGYFLVLGVDFDEPQGYAVMVDTSGAIVRKQAVSSPVTSFDMYHAGGVYWSGDGMSYRVRNDGWFDAITGESREDPIPVPAAVAVGSTQIRRIDRGQYSEIPSPCDYGLYERFGDDLVLRYSVAELMKLRERLHPDWDGFPDTPIDVCDPKLSGDQQWYLFEFGNHEAARLAGDHPPRVNEMWVCSADLRTVYPVIPYRKDALTFLNHGTFDYPVATRAIGAVGTGVAIANLDGGGLRYLELGEYWFAGGGGHPSLSPDKKWLIYDTYNTYGKLLLVNMTDGSMRELLSVPRMAGSVPQWWVDHHANHGNGPADVDLHPNWSVGGKIVTFNGMEGDLSQVYAIDLSSLLV